MNSLLKLWEQTVSLKTDFVLVVFPAGFLVCDIKWLSGSSGGGRRCCDVTLGRQLWSEAHSEENATQGDNENSGGRLSGMACLQL